MTCTTAAETCLSCGRIYRNQYLKKGCDCPPTYPVKDLPYNKIVSQNYTLSYVKYSMRDGMLFEEWTEIRCGTCKTNKTCEDKVDKSFQGCDKWQTI